jgi:hypothetical protein
VKNFIFILVGLGFVLRASLSPSGLSTAWATLQSILLWLFWRWSHSNFAQPYSKLWSSESQPVKRVVVKYWCESLVLAWKTCKYSR